ncbi:GTPase required for pre-60S ribosomal subunit nuclear export and maturation [Mycoemilia scoparia]|uniref:Nucleolar GTP-binding protein 2 n=1 Tax=Mycoemilia scoparia TaxID=417184 RepID=A0A9W8A4M1_9FUNG|nr:GTPase required for pre-60S ribosomal subunit nuclear export and maturation [Mycoemilia scoparia]
MGKAKKEASRVSTDPGNQKMKGENFYRDKKKLKYLNMLKSGRAVRDRDGKIIKAAPFQSSEAKTARIEPNRRWFGNTRVIGHQVLEDFREKLGSKVNDPYQVLLRQNKLPMSLLQNSSTVGRVNLLETESFSDTFGTKAQRKKPKLDVSMIEQYGENAMTQVDSYEPKKDQDLVENQYVDFADKAREWYFNAGSSKRIWNELYKVVDSSDVIIHVLDARDPNGTRCRHVENYIKSETPHKHLVYVLNKVDLVPTWVTSRWVQSLSKEYPTLAFHASINNSFGKGSLIQLLRQFSKLHSEKRQISVGFIGYPNTGKSSIINTLRKKKVCNVAPIPGETKVWQYITLMRNIYLIDCPGIVQASANDTEEDIVLRGSIRIENLNNPEDYIQSVLDRVRKEYVQRTYNVDHWEDSEEFLTEVAKATGKLNKGGEPDLHVVAKMVLTDWVRGKLPRYSIPPDYELKSSTDKAGEQSVQSIQAADGSAQEQKNDSDESPDQPKHKSKKGVTIGVTQHFKKIVMATEYLPVDLEGTHADEDSTPAPEPTATKKGQPASQDATQQTQEDEPDWDDVFQSAVGEEVSSIPDDSAGNGSGKSKNDEEPDSELDSEGEDGLNGSDSDANDSRDTKHSRMTTNKKKVGVHYYETANVKNKNRKKRTPENPDRLAKKLRHSGKWKVGSK